MVRVPSCVRYVGMYMYNTSVHYSTVGTQEAVLTAAALGTSGLCGLAAPFLGRCKGIQEELASLDKTPKAAKISFT